MRKKRIKTVEAAAKELSVRDISELNADHSVEFISLLPRMDREVVQQILKLCPDLIQITRDEVNAFIGICSEAIKQGGKNNDAVIEAYKAIIVECQKILASKRLSHRKKERVLNMMLDVADKMHEADMEHKKWLKAALGHAVEGMGVVAAGIIGVVALGRIPHKPGK